MLRDVYWLRDATSKAVRRVKKLIGRPDSTPWVLRPNRAAAGDGTADLVVSLASPDEGPLLLSALRRAAAQHGLKVEIADAGETRGRVVLNLSTSPATGTYTIGDTAHRVEWSNRVRAHEKLTAAGVPVSSVNDFQARRVPRPVGRTSYLHAYNLLGARTVLWRTPETGRYDLVGWDEVRELELLQAIAMVDQLARATELDYFSCEIAVTTTAGQPRFVVTDFDADPRELLAIDERPAEWGKWACERIAEFVWRQTNNVAAPAGRAMWLPNRSNSAVGTGKQAVVNAA